MAQGFHEVPVGFCHFIELQLSIDEFYEEYNRLDEIKRLEESGEILNNSGAALDQLRKLMSYSTH